MQPTTEIERREIARVVTTVLFGVVLMSTFGLASLGGFLYCVGLALTSEQSGVRVLGGILASLVMAPTFIYMTAASMYAMKGRSGGVLMGFVPLLVLSPFWLIWVVVVMASEKPIKGDDMLSIAGVLVAGLLLALGWVSLSDSRKDRQPD
jgi:hypothetical protein